MGRKLKRKFSVSSLGQWVSDSPANHVSWDAIQEEGSQWCMCQWRCEDNESGFEPVVFQVSLNYHMSNR